MQGVSLQWFESYLSARDHLAPIIDNALDTRGIDLSAAQVCSLWPVLFNFYINDLFTTIFFQSILYDNDTSLYASSPNLHELIAQVNV